jgi:hypothetical protein
MDRMTPLSALKFERRFERGLMKNLLLRTLVVAAAAFAAPAFAQDFPNRAGIKPE